MFLKYLALAALLSGTAREAASNCAPNTRCPIYSAAGIVNTADYTTGPFAPNSVVTIFGKDLADSAQAAVLAPGATYLPLEFNGVRVFVSDSPAALFYTSESQINFLMPSDRKPGDVTIWVANNGNEGPDITVAVVDAAPALFSTAGGYAIATHADSTLLTADSPAHPAETVVIYLTGLGRTSPNPAPGQILQNAAQMVPAQLSKLTISLGGITLDPVYIKYAGLTPGSAGLYQINLYLPDSVGTDPEIRVAVAGQSSPAGLKLPVR